MHRTTALLLWMGLWLPTTGVMYFCGLLMAAPLGLVVVVSLGAGAGLAVWISRVTVADAAPPLEKREGILLLAGIGSLAIACAFLSRRYGDWDAALIWNLHARHLAAGESWRAIYEPGASGNAAYPLGLPSTVALAWGALGTSSQTVPFFIALLPTMGIPVVIFLEGARRNLWLSIAVLALFGLHGYYLALGLDQYADIQVAWLWLLASACIGKGVRASRTAYGIAAGMLLGALCWTKWDGVLLTVCLLVSHNRYIFRSTRALFPIFLGAIPFLLAIALFLQSGPPRAPLLTDVDGIISRLVDGERYQMIGSAFLNEAIGRHRPLAAVLIATPLLWRRSSSNQSRRLYWTVIAAILGYAAVYLTLVSTDLPWNLQFSLPRLLLQVYPVAVLSAALAWTSRERRNTLR